MTTKMGYFQRVHALSPTRFWVNNPTPEQARQAIAAGAISCTTNPTYAFKQFQTASEKAEVSALIADAVRKTLDDQMAADLVQQRLVKRILDIFLPLYEKDPDRQGFVSIQGNPFKETNPGSIVEEALRYRALGRNFIAKIPVTSAGIDALEALIPENIPMIATEVMSLSQTVQVCEMYRRVSEACGEFPPFYVTHITGIFDEYLDIAARQTGSDITPDHLWQAGSIIARRQYALMKERKYPGIMLGGGARGLQHFTEFVGGDLHITINWSGTAEALIEQDPPVVYRIGTPAPEHVIEELREKLPDFEKAYREDGLQRSEFEDFGPVVLFRNSFLKGWQALLNVIETERRK